MHARSCTQGHARKATALQDHALSHRTLSFRSFSAHQADGYQTVFEFVCLHSNFSESLLQLHHLMTVASHPYGKTCTGLTSCAGPSCRAPFHSNLLPLPACSPVPQKSLLALQLPKPTRASTGWHVLPPFNQCWLTKERAGRC
jgi:hypothetical protein